MFTKKILVAVIFALSFFVLKTNAQTATTFVTGLRSPVKIIYSQRDRHFLVSEAGSAGATNNGRVSIVNTNGSVTTLIDNLPSGPAAPNNDPSGPAALWLNDNSLYIAIGNGNATLAGPAPGSEIPNPNPASPLFSSVLELRMPAASDLLNQSVLFPFRIQPADHVRLANGETISFGFGRFPASLRMVANFPDFTPSFRPDVPNNVRPSNPFGLVGFGNKLYVADAAQNNIRSINLVSGQTEVFFTYPPRPNPAAPPPFVDAVPDSLRLFGNTLLITFLTGFPFPAGRADVRQIDLESGADSQFIGGLSSAIDVLPVSSGFCNSFYTLEFSTSMTTGAPGRLQRFDSPGGAPTVISGSLITPTSMARNPSNGDLLITEVGPGRITRISFP